MCVIMATIVFKCLVFKCSDFLSQHHSFDCNRGGTYIYVRISTQEWLIIPNSAHLFRRICKQAGSITARA